MKRRYKCELIDLVPVPGQPLGTWVALIRRHEEHEKLGPVRAESHTQTSLIVRIDFEKKEIETLNSVYCYGDT